eukprot:jgi/Ulvmu1/12675/UM094_0031.1
MADLSTLYKNILATERIPVPHQDNELPHVAVAQQQYVRYPGEQYAHETTTGWHKSRDPESNSDNAWALPDRLSVQVLQAPLCWLLPMRRESPPRPPFKVEVVVESAARVSVAAPAVHPHILTADELMLGAPPEARERGVAAPWLHQWRPPTLASGAGDSPFLDSSGAAAFHSVRTLPPLPDAPHRSCYIFDFHHLHFVQASGLTMVYMLFWLQMQTGAFVITLMVFPTICIAHGSQQSKALGRLREHEHHACAALTHLAAAYQYSLPPISIPASLQPEPPGAAAAASAPPLQQQQLEAIMAAAVAASSGDRAHARALTDAVRSPLSKHREAAQAVALQPRLATADTVHALPDLPGGPAPGRGGGESAAVAAAQLLQPRGAAPDVRAPRQHSTAVAAAAAASAGLDRMVDAVDAGPPRPGSAQLRAALQELVGNDISRGGLAGEGGGSWQDVQRREGEERWAGQRGGRLGLLARLEELLSETGRGEASPATPRMANLLEDVRLREQHANDTLASLSQLPEWHRGTKRPHPPEISYFDPNLDPRFQPTSRPGAEPPPHHAASFPGFADPSPPHRRASAGAALGAPHSPPAMGEPSRHSLSPRLFSSGLFAEDLSQAARAAQPQRWSSPGAASAAGLAMQAEHSTAGLPLLHAPLSSAAFAAAAPPGHASVYADVAQGRSQRDQLSATVSQPALAAQGLPAADWIRSAAAQIAAQDRGLVAEAARASWPPAPPVRMRAPTSPAAAEPLRSPGAGDAAAASLAAAPGRCPDDELLSWSRRAAEAANAGLPEPPYPAAAHIPEPVRAWHDVQTQPLVPVVRWALLNLQGLLDSRTPDYHAFVAALERATRDALSRRDQNLPLVSLHELFSLPLRLPTIVFAAQRRRVSVGGSLPPLHPAEQPPPRTTVVSCLVCNDEGTEPVTTHNLGSVFRKLPPYASTAGIPELSVLLGLRYCGDGDVRPGHAEAAHAGMVGEARRAAAGAGDTADTAAPSTLPQTSQEHNLATREGATAAAQYMLARLPGSQGPALSVAPLVEQPDRSRPVAAAMLASPHSRAAALGELTWPLGAASASQGSGAMTATAHCVSSGARAEHPPWSHGDAEQPVRAAIDLLRKVDPQKLAAERSGVSSAQRLLVPGGSEGATGGGGESHGGRGGPQRRLAVNLLERISLAPSGGQSSAAAAGPSSGAGGRSRAVPPLPPLPPLHPTGPPPLRMPDSETLAALQQALQEAQGEGAQGPLGRGGHPS